MDRKLELTLLEELQGLKDNEVFFPDDAARISPVSRYCDPDRFEAEVKSVFGRVPLVAAHSSELRDAGSFLTRNVAGLPILLTRDSEWQIHAFLNACRHRGARLVSQDQGCANVFSCPSHAWTYDSHGKLRGIPHRESGFPGIDHSAYSLRRLPAEERLGLVWMSAEMTGEPDFDSVTAPLVADFEWCGMADLDVFRSDRLQRAANWKLLIEGGLESYHFKVAHRDTIGPHFADNLSSYQMPGPHTRSVLPRNSLLMLTSEPRESWPVRKHANVLYTVFPAAQFLVMADCVAWIPAGRPLRTRQTCAFAPLPRAPRSRRTTMLTGRATTPSR